WKNHGAFWTAQETPAKICHIADLIHALVLHAMRRDGNLAAIVSDLTAGILRFRRKPSKMSAAG
ncbi:MAG: hypothetical protein LC674_00780, partial [Actinobacteria bacterium]|nr:hypothetical protein [Actinomycetota bacterium]